MRDAAIGIFDSGLGGLTTVKEIIRLLPREDIIYLGDTAGAPYGDKNRDTLIKCAKRNIAFLLSKGVKIIVIACGTISSLLDSFDVTNEIPFEGVITPTCMSASKYTKNNKIGVIATSAAVESHAYLAKLNELNPSLDITEKACPKFVPFIESGIMSEENRELFDCAIEYLSPFKQNGIDTLILGCTHYGIIGHVIRTILGENVKLVDSGKETARCVCEKIKKANLLNEKSTYGYREFFVTKYTPEFAKTAQIFLNEDIKYNLRTVDLNKIL